MEVPVSTLQSDGRGEAAGPSRGGRSARGARELHRYHGQRRRPQALLRGMGPAERRSHQACLDGNLVDIAVQFTQGEVSRESRQSKF